jgi:hypothetical protein
MASRLLPALVFCLLALPSALGQPLEWQAVTHGSGLSFRTELENSNHSCAVRFREDKKLRRTTSELRVTYNFAQSQHSQTYSAHFEARDTDTLYIPACESVVGVVAIKVQRF